MKGPPIMKLFSLVAFLLVLSALGCTPAETAGPKTPVPHDHDGDGKSDH